MSGVKNTDSIKINPLCKFCNFAFIPLIKFIGILKINTFLPKSVIHQPKCYDDEISQLLLLFNKEVQTRDHHEYKDMISEITGKNCIPIESLLSFACGLMSDPKSYSSSSRSWSRCELF